MQAARPIVLILAALSLTAATLPDQVPVPLPKPETGKSETGTKEKPAAEKDDQKTVATPEDKPEQDKEKPTTATPEKKDEPVATTPAEELVIEPEDAKDYAACLADLTTMTTVFKRPTLSTTAGAAASTSRSP